MPPKGKGKGKRPSSKADVRGNKKRARGKAGAASTDESSPCDDAAQQPKGSVGDQLSSHVVNLHQSLAEFHAWIESGEGAAARAGTLRNSLGEVLEQMEQHSGKSVIFVGRNGVGKSWIINILLLLTVATPSEYESQNAELKVEGNSVEQPPEDYVSADDDSDFKDLRRALEGFCDGNNITQSVKEFMLPSRDLGCSTTRSLITIEYSTNFCCSVQYLKLDDIKVNAWEWVQLNQDVFLGSKDRAALTDDLGRAAQMYYETVVVEEQKGFAEGSADWISLESKNDLLLQERVLNAAGKTKEYHGRGKNFHLDRQWVREKLKHIATHPEDGYIQHSVRVGMPCKVVADCGKISDSPGCNTADPYLTQVLRRGLDDHEIVIAVGSRQIGDESGTIEALQNSKFLTNLLNHPETYHLAYLHYREKSLWVELRDRADNILGGDTEELDALQQEEGRTLATTRDSLTRNLFARFCNSTEEAAQAMKRVTVLSVWPTLFASIELNTSFRVNFTTRNSADALEKLLKFTCTAELLSLPQFIKGQGSRTKFTSFRTALERAILHERHPDQGSSALLSDEVLDVVQKAQAFAVPNRGGRSSAEAKMAHEEFEKKLGSLLERARKKAIEKAASIIRKSVPHEEDEDNEDNDDDDNNERDDDLLKRFSSCAEKAAAAWERGSSPVNKLTDDTKKYLSAKWALSDSRLNIAQLLFESLHDHGGVKFDFVIATIKTVLDDTVKELVEAAIQFVKDRLFMPVKTDSGLARRLNEYFAASVEPIVKSRCELFFSYSRRTMHLTEENLSGLLVKAEEKAMKKELTAWYSKERRQKKAAVLKNELKAHIPEFVAAVADELADSLGALVNYQFKQLKQHLLITTRPARKQTGMYSVVVLTFDFASSLGLENAEAGPTGPGEAADELEGYLNECDQLAAKCGYNGPRELAAVAQTITEQMEILRLERDLELRYNINLLKQAKVVPCVKRNGTLPTPCTPGELMSVVVDESAILQLQQTLKRKGLHLVPQATDAGPVSPSSLFEALSVQWWGESELTEERALQLRYRVCSKVNSLRQQSKQEEFKTAFKLAVIPPEWQQLLSSESQYAEQLSLPETPGDMFCLFILAWDLGQAIDVWCSGKEKPLFVCEATISERRKRHAYQLAVVQGKDSVLSGDTKGYEFKSCLCLPDSHPAPRPAAPDPVPRPVSASAQARLVRSTRSATRRGPADDRLILIVDAETLFTSLARPPSIFSRRVSADDMQSQWRQIQDFHSSQMKKLLILQPLYDLVIQRTSSSDGSTRKMAQNAMSLINFKLKPEENTGNFWELQTLEDKLQWMRKWPGNFSDNQRTVLWAKECNRTRINAVIVTTDPRFETVCRTNGVPSIKPTGRRDDPGLLDLINLHLAATGLSERREVDYAELVRKHLAPG